MCWDVRGECDDNATTSAVIILTMFQIQCQIVSHLSGMAGCLSVADSVEFVLLDV